MHSLQKQFHDQIISKQLFKKEEKLLVAVSGGVDSMVLAHLLLSANLSFSVAHCNFGLRGADSDKDEKLVREWSKKNGIECYVKHFELEGSIQLAARNARYDWFHELMKENEYDLLATAHHLNDSLETTLINLSRGSGIKGLSGIPQKKGKVVRPLLAFSKEQLIAYALNQNISWREDISNESSDYGRNLVRNEVVPLLELLNPSLKETFKNTVERLQLTNQLLHSHVEEIKKSNFQEKDDLWVLNTGWIEQDSDLLLLFEIVSVFGFNYVTVKEIHSSLNHSGKLFLAPDYELSIDRECIYIKRKSNENDQEIVIQGEGQFQINEQSLSVSIIAIEEVDFGSNQNVAFFNLESLTFPLSIRKWKTGDRFKPLGMKGNKKVSDYLIDRKIPLALKSDARVVISNDEIIWLVGYQISEDFKVENDVKQVLRLKIE